jgi:hypothetical protein
MYPGPLSQARAIPEADSEAAINNSPGKSFRPGLLFKQLYMHSPYYMLT